MLKNSIQFWANTWKLANSLALSIGYLNMYEIFRFELQLYSYLNKLWLFSWKQNVVTSFRNFPLTSLLIENSKSFQLYFTYSLTFFIFFFRYNMVFRFLLSVRKVQIELHQCWALQMRSKDAGYQSSFMPLWKLRSHMSFLIDNFQYYVLVCAFYSVF